MRNVCDEHKLHPPQNQLPRVVNCRRSVLKAQAAEGFSHHKEAGHSPHSKAYAASKGGLIALTHALAMSLGPDLRANSISPGWIDVSAWQAHAPSEPQPLSAADHNQHPSGRVGTPDDVAAMVAYLVSPEARFVTGQNFVIDGGMTRKMIYED